jgi:transposase
MTKNLKHDYKEPYVFFITNLEEACKALECYAQRWKIECCFKHLKSNGFNIKAMNFKDDRKIELMMGIVVTAYAIAIREGLIEQFRKPFFIKKYKCGKQYAAISVFRKGIEMVEIFLKHASALVLYLFAVFNSENKQRVAANYVKNVR